MAVDDVPAGGWGTCPPTYKEETNFFGVTERAINHTANGGGQWTTTL